jgi:hypothetical protein
MKNEKKNIMLRISVLALFAHVSLNLKLSVFFLIKFFGKLVDSIFYTIHCILIVHEPFVGKEKNFSII